MAEVRLVTFNAETVTPQDDAILYQSCTVDGVYSNCEVTISSSTSLHISGTFAIMGGRFIEISEQDITVPLATSSSNMVGQLYLSMDLSNTDNPLDLLVDVAQSESELIEMITDDDININNSQYMMRLCLFGVNNASIFNLDDPTSTNIPVVANILPKNQNVAALLESQKCIVITTNTFSSLPQTINDDKIKNSHVVVNSVLSNPSAQTSDWSVTTSNGSLTISGSISGTTSLTLYLIEQQ